MTDRSDSTPPPVFREADHLFRRSLLWMFDGSEELAALRKVAGIMTEWLDEYGTWTSDETLLRGYLRAAAEDLLLTAAFIREFVANDRKTSSLPADELRLSEMADSWVQRAERLGKAMLGALEVHAGSGATEARA